MNIFWSTYLANDGRPLITCRLGLKTYHYECGKSVYLFGLWITDWYRSDPYGWVRVFGIRLCWKRMDKTSLTFSQRNGYTNAIIWNGYFIHFEK